MSAAFYADETASTSPRICAVVVTYNRKALLMECLDALIHQSAPLAGICLVDNASSDGTAVSLHAAGYLDALPPTPAKPVSWIRNTEITASNGGQVTLHYLHMPTNGGGAGGFHAGMQHAALAGFDGLWIMDDDAKPARDALARLVERWNEPNLSALAGAVNSNTGLSLSHRGYFDFRFNRVFPLLHKPVPQHRYACETLDIDMASFVGLLVKNEAIRRAGLPRKEFFLHNDDAEYCIRLRECGRILLVPASKIEHQEARGPITPDNKEPFLSRTRPRYDQLWLMYFGLRNLTWVGKTYHKSSPRFLSAVLGSWLRAVTSVLLFDRDHKWKRMRFLTSAYADGLRGVFDNAKPRRILYGSQQTDL